MQAYLCCDDALFTMSFYNRQATTCLTIAAIALASCWGAVFCGGAECTDASYSRAGSITFSSVSEEVNLDGYDGETILVESTKTVSMTPAEKVRLLERIDDGCVVVSIGSASVFDKLKDDVSFCLDTSLPVSALMYDKASRMTYCYSSATNSQADALEEVKEWARSIDRSASYTLTNGAWGDGIVNFTHYDFGEWGEANVQNVYRSLEENNLRYNYYFGLHNVEVIPASGHKTVYVETVSQPFNYDTNSKDRYLCAYAPTGTEGTTTVGASLGFNCSSTGEVTVGATVSWSYSIEDIVVHNYSNLNQDLFRLKHSFNKNANCSSETRMISPGHTVVVDTEGGYFNNGTYLGTDDFNFKFQKPLKTIWPFTPKVTYKTFENSLNVNMVGNEKVYTLHGNGETGNHYYEHVPYSVGPEGYSVYTHNVSQGASITLGDEGFYKDDHVLVGFSTSSNSNVVAYAVGQSIRMASDLDLYCVWRHE